MTALSGGLRYLIGADGNPHGEVGYVTECGYDATRPPLVGQGVKYGNLMNEKFSEQTPQERDFYGPYLHDSDTAEVYGEGQIDPRGPGWTRNLDKQFSDAKTQGFHCLELDNADAYTINDVLDAVDRAWHSHLDVMAKNPMIVEGNGASYLSHPAVVGVVVEKGAGTCDGMEALRRSANRPLLPVWFVSFGPRGLPWARAKAEVIRYRRYRSMGVSFSPHGEYTNSVDVLVPFG